MAFVAVGFLVLSVVSSQARSQTEAAARGHAEFVTNSILAETLKPGDLTGPAQVGSARYRDLRNLVRAEILHASFPVVRVKVWRADGTVLFSDESRLVGRNFAVDEDLAEAFTGRVTSDVSNLSEPENLYERRLGSRLFETYVPLHLGQGQGHPQAVAEVYSDLTPVSATVGHSFRMVGLDLPPSRDFGRGRPASPGWFPRRRHHAGRSRLRRGAQDMERRDRQAPRRDRPLR